MTTPTGWLERAARNMLPLSVNQTNFEVAKLEWRPTGVIRCRRDDGFDEYGNPIDGGFELSSCQLCEHHPVANFHQIKNIETGHSLWIGCECIKRFDPTYESPNQKIVNYKKKRQHDRICQALIQLCNKTQSDFFASLTDYYIKNKRFTPKQLTIVIKALDRYAVPYDASDFHIDVRKKRLQSLAEMKQSEIAVIRDLLPAKITKGIPCTA